MNEERGKIIIGLKKAHSLVGRIIKMTESGDYCIDIMRQNLAAIGLLRAAHEGLMKNHVNGCFKSALASGSPAKQRKMTDEILQVTNLFNK